MSYALNLGENGRILSATYPQFASEGNVMVEALPQGSIADYRYVEGAYLYDPISEPEPEPAVPTLEDRVAALEGVTDDMVLLMAELIGG